jgi:CheY-like chemotaxis protein
MGSVSEALPGVDAVPSGAGPGTVLLVDDEDMLREALRDILEYFGFKVLDAEDGAQGLVLFQRHAKEIRLVILDLTMPGMGGEEVLERLRSQPGEVGRIPVLLSSGFTGVNVAAILGADRFTGFLQKPYTIQQLAAKVAECLGSVF